MIVSTPVCDALDLLDVSGPHEVGHRAQPVPPCPSTLQEPPQCMFDFSRKAM